MISLNGFIHRDQLTSIIGRWIICRQQPDDGRRLKQLVNFNSYVGRICLDEIARSLLGEVHGAPVRSFVASTKAELKDFVIRSPARQSPRIAEMIWRYKRYPEDYYRETPFDGRIYHLNGEGESGGRYLGSTRIKRFRRIAEKGSRRIIDYMFERVKANAEVLAGERAARLGIPKEQMITPYDEQVAEFTHAERRVLKAIRLGTISDSLPILNINDILGLKLVAEGDTRERVLELLTAGERTEIVEHEEHRGNYSATNLIVKYRWPRETLLARSPEGRAREVLVMRGLPAEQIDGAYREFVESAEDDVYIEVILAGCQDMLESEIGRCMHEERVLAQRSHQQYQGSLAKNIGYLMEYMLLYCLSARDDPGEIPYKLWIRYMPDYADQVVRRLFGFPPEAQFTGLL